MNLITTVIGFGMSATFIVFVCTRLICGRIRGDRSRPMYEIESRIDLEQPEHSISGLEPVAVAAIPTMKFSHEAFSSLEDAQCSICLGEYQEKEVLRIMPKCSHNFHLSCIDEWLRKQSTCPVCRITLQSIDSPEISTEHSHQWLLPANPQRSTGNRSNLQPVHGNTETVLSVEIETRR